MKKAWGIIFAVVILGLFLTKGAVYLELFKDPSHIHSLKWEKLRSSPGGTKKYKPQGISTFEKFIVISNHWNDKKSRIYFLNKKTFEQQTYFDMPIEASHTSGLALDFDKGRLWAADFNSGSMYLIDVEKSVKTKHAHILKTISTNLGGLSACVCFEFGNKKYFAVSDFLHSCKTYILDYERFRSTDSLKASVVLSYHNQCFSQGLAYRNGYLFESVNKMAKDVIIVYDFRLLLQHREAAPAIAAVFEAPASGVEDLVFEGAQLFTSSEKTFLIYKSTVPAIQ